LGVKGLSAILQLSITPVALISGIGLLLLSMTNRLARTIDISRNLVRELQQASSDRRAAIQFQLLILYKRSRYLRLAISLSLVSILFSSLIIFCLFAIAYLHWSLGHLVLAFWGLGIVSLVISLLFFIQDITLTLRALKRNLKQHIELN